MDNSLIEIQNLFATINQENNSNIDSNIDIDSDDSNDNENSINDTNIINENQLHIYHHSDTNNYINNLGNNLNRFSTHINANISGIITNSINNSYNSYDNYNNMIIANTDNINQNIDILFNGYTQYLAMSNRDRTYFNNSLLNIINQNPRVNMLKNLIKNNSINQSIQDEQSEIINNLLNELIIQLIICSSDNIRNIYRISNEMSNTINLYNAYKNKLVLFKTAFKKYSKKIKDANNKLKIINEEINKKNIPDNLKCPICITNIKTHIIIPCGHKCICGDCSDKILTTKMCPICRSDIATIIKVYD